MYQACIRQYNIYSATIQCQVLDCRYQYAFEMATSLSQHVCVGEVFFKSKSYDPRCKHMLLLCQCYYPVKMVKTDYNPIFLSN